MSTSTRSRSLSVNTQKGFAHLVIVLVMLFLGTILVSASIKTSRSYISDVQGVSTESVLKSKADFKVASMEGKIVVVEKNSGATSKFPLTIDPKTNALTVTTPAGVKIVTILPDAAISNALSSRLITEVESSDTTGSLGSLGRVVDLEERNGSLVYKVSGKRKNLVLGLIPIKTSVTAYVSADTGQVVESSQSIFGRVLNKISKAAD